MLQHTAVQANTTLQGTTAQPTAPQLCASWQIDIQGIRADWSTTHLATDDNGDVHRVHHIKV